VVVRKVSKPKVPKRKKPRPKPITSGSAAITLGNTRGVALTLFNQRVLYILASDFTGLAAVVLWLGATTNPLWYLLLALIAGSIGIIWLHVFAIQVIEGSAARVDHWTDKLIALENTNGIEGGVKIFSSLEYETLKKKPALSFIHLIWIMRACMVVWVVIGATALMMFLKSIGVEPWQKFLEHCLQ